MTTPYSPGDPNRPGNRKLAGATAALAVALAAVLASGVLHQTPPTITACAAGRVPIGMRDVDTAQAYSMGDTVFVAAIKLWPPDSASRAGAIPKDSSLLFSSIELSADSTGFRVLPDSGRSLMLATYCAMVPPVHRAQVVSTMPDDTAPFPPPGAVH